MTQDDRDYALEMNRWRDEEHRRLMAVGRALTAEQREEIVTRFTGLNPHWRGADVEDILDALADGDSDLAQTEPFYEEHPEVAEIAGSPYACRALIWSGQGLTEENMRSLLTAAGLTED